LIVEQNLIIRRNKLLYQLLTVGVILDIIFNFIAGVNPEMIPVFILSIVVLFIFGFLIKKEKFPTVVMYSLLSVILLIVVFANILSMTIANLLFFYLIPVTAALYQRWKDIVISNMITATLFCYFASQGGTRLLGSTYLKSDLFFFVLIFVITAIISAVYARHSDSLLKQNRDMISELEASQKRNEEVVLSLQENATAVAEFSSILNGQINDASQLSSTTEESFKEMSVSINSQTQSMTDINVSIEKINRDISTVSKETREMLVVSTESKNTTQLANQEVIKLQDEIEQVSDTIDLTVNLMKELDESSNQILRSTEDIKEISATVNIISLNASIESSRIDSNNVQTFSVIAEEIKILADRTAATTNQIHRIILDLINKTNKVLATVENTQSNMTSTKSSMENVKDAFKNLEKALEETVSKSIKIENLTENLAEASTEIVSSTNDVTAVTEQNLSSVEAILSGIKTQNKQLQEVVIQFKELENKVQI